MARSGLLVLLALSAAFAAFTPLLLAQLVKAKLSYAWYDTAYILPPIGEIGNVIIDRTSPGNLSVLVGVQGLQRAEAAVGLCAQGDCEWKWGKLEPGEVRSFEFHGREGGSIEVRLWGAEQFVQSVGIYNLASCGAMEGAGKAGIDEVGVEWVDERTARISIYARADYSGGGDIGINLNVWIWHESKSEYVAHVFKGVAIHGPLDLCFRVLRLRIDVGPVKFLKDGTYHIKAHLRVRHGDREEEGSAERTIRVGRPVYHVVIRAVHADGSAVAGARICVDGRCAHANSSGAVAFELEEGRHAVRAEAEYDVSGTRIRYSGERSIYVSGSASIDVELRPERCVYVREFRLDKAEVEPGGMVAGRAEFVLARCCAGCTASLVVYGWKGSEVARLWDGPVEAHRVIAREFSFTAPERPGRYCVTLNFLLGPRAPPGEEVGRACFTVKATPRPISIVYVTNATVPAGGTGTVKIVLDRAPGGLSGYSLWFTTRPIVLLSNVTAYCQQASLQCTVADVRIEGVSFPDWARLSDWRRVDNYTVELKAVDLSDAVRPGARNVVLAEIAVRALTSGIAVATVFNETLDDDGGHPIPVVVRPGAIYVPGCPKPVGGVVPRDLDGDGLYEDLNGNGRLDYDDVVRLFRHFEDPAVRECWRLYDFNRNGRLDYDDIVTLFRKVP
jgi:PKD repeat protein